MSNTAVWMAQGGGTMYVGSGGRIVVLDGGVIDASLGTIDVGTIALGTNAVATANIQNSAVTTAKIADGAVTSAKLAVGSIDGSTITAATITSTQLATGSVTSTQIAAGAVGTTDLADGSVTTAKLADGSVTSAKLAAGVGGSSLFISATITSDGNPTVIPHGLGVDPTAANVFFSVMDTAATVSWSFTSLTTDATNITVTATSTLKFRAMAQKPS